jgi:endonuclease/exonuclease/phosphatase family metal-dependent hydrolase
MDTHARLVGTVVLCILATGCSGDKSSNTPQPVGFATFNTALLAQAQNVEQRLRTIARDLPGLGADVVCLQEVWQPEHTKLLVSSVEKEFPYAHWSVETGTEALGCSQTETDLLIGCVDARCADVGPASMAGCAVSNCANEYAAVSVGCQKCVLANQTQSPETIATNCQSVDADQLAYENQNGLVLLSKHPFTSKGYRPFPTSLGDRGVLFAQIETALMPAVDLFCTHLAATLPEVTYVGTYGTWEGERSAQIEVMAEFMQEQKSGHTTVVMGDMNCGPASAGITAEDAAGFDQLIDLGLDAPYLDNGEARCTYCGDNALVGNSEAQNVLIDHVLFSDLPDSTHCATHRVFDEPITLNLDGVAVETYRSDHYGQLVECRGAR